MGLDNTVRVGEGDIVQAKVESMTQTETVSIAHEGKNIPKVEDIVQVKVDA